MFANICFEKNQNSKIHVMFIIKHNMKWNMKNQVLPSAIITWDFFRDKILSFDSCNQTWHGSKQEYKLSQENWPNMCLTRFLLWTKVFPLLSAVRPKQPCCSCQKYTLMVDIFVNHLFVNHEMDTQWKKVESKEKQVSLIFPRHVSLSWQKCSFVVEFYRPSYKKSKTTKGNVLQSPRIQGGHVFS